MDNRTLASRLTTLAHSMEKRNASLFRVRAYRRAAETLLGLECPVEKLVEQGGRRLLSTLPGIGPNLSRTIEALLHEKQSA